MSGSVASTSCPQCGAPLPPFVASSASQVCGHCGAHVRLRVEPVAADLERRVSALERIRAPIRRRFRRRAESSSESALSPGRTLFVEVAAVIGCAAAGAVVDGEAPLAGALAFGAVAGLFVLGLVLVSRSGPRRRRRSRRLEQR